MRMRDDLIEEFTMALPVKAMVIVDSELDTNLLREKISAEVGTSLHFIIENRRGSPVVVESADSERQMAKISIPVTIIMFTERDAITKIYVKLITQGITNVVQMCGSQAEVVSTVFYEPSGQAIVMALQAKM